VSSGFGQALAREALVLGHRVIGTVRNREALRAFEALDSQRACGYLLDVTNVERIDEVVEEIESTIGPIDVLVNNAGYGHEGILEES
ncbi:SDR family NAD(P)-dependent oxidoreductase, partial [Klebsiella pneumoniae]